MSKKKNPNLSFFIKINLDYKTEIDKLIKILNTKFKKIDILINNAGYVGESSINKVTDSKIFYNEKYENLNLTNSIYLTNSLVPLIKKSKSASIIKLIKFAAADPNLLFLFKI